MSTDGQNNQLLGKIQFQNAERCLFNVSNEKGRIIGVFDILDSTYKPLTENTYHKIGCDPF